MLHNQPYMPHKLNHKVMEKKDIEFTENSQLEYKSELCGNELMDRVIVSEGNEVKDTEPHRLQRKRSPSSRQSKFIIH